MKIVIQIEKKIIEISLKKGKNKLEKTVFPDERDLGEKLIPTVDKMLKKAKIEPKDIQKVEVASDQSDSFTTTRIAKTFATVFNWEKTRKSGK
jgi:tRNA A37 threonylcarbamoyladenosine modification protein TsaB